MPINCVPVPSKIFPLAIDLLSLSQDDYFIVADTLMAFSISSCACLDAHVLLSKQSEFLVLFSQACSNSRCASNLRFSEFPNNCHPWWSLNVTIPEQFWEFSEPQDLPNVSGSCQKTNNNKQKCYTLSKTRQKNECITRVLTFKPENSGLFKQ